MQYIGNARETDEAGQLFMRRLKKGCRVMDACKGAFHDDATEAGGRDGAGKVFLHPRGFWFTLRHEQGGGLVAALGMGRPLLGEEPRPACLMPVGISPASRAQELPGRGSLFFARFGGDVLAVHDGTTDAAPGQDFMAFLEARGYGPTVHSLAGPDGVERKVAIVASVASPDPGADVMRFVSAVNDFRQWRAQGLEPAGGTGCAEAGLEGGAAGTSGAFAGGGLHALVLEGLRASLEKYAQARGLGCTVADSPSGGLALCSREGTVLAAFQARPDLAAEGLYDAVGRLLICRGNVRAAKFLVLPGGLGPYFSQALFRHDIQAVRYQLRGSAVVLDAGEIFAAIDA